MNSVKIHPPSLLGGLFLFFGEYFMNNEFNEVADFIREMIEKYAGDIDFSELSDDTTEE